MMAKNIYSFLSWKFTSAANRPAFRQYCDNLNNLLSVLVESHVARLAFAYNLKTSNSQQKLLKIFFLVYVFTKRLSLNEENNTIQKY